MDVIDHDRWQVVRQHLDAVLDLDEPQRTAWLASLCEDDPALAADLQILLDEHRELNRARFLEDPVPMATPAGLAGHTIGAYTLLSSVGHGGMGNVWLAARNDGRFDRHVAVKFLHVALAGRGEDRFKREGALLGRLTHANIACLLDAGVSPSGQPFLILEYVDGEPIDRYCDQQRLSVDARVRLFLDVLAAVAHAHANLIVHRDIKPSNVCVNRDGQVKLLDFGIAKLLEEDSPAGAATALTREAGVALTPEYAAPEQMTGGAITTATDVYALGVLLYVLLTGHHPAGDTRRSTADIVKAVVDAEPPRMSTIAPPALQRQLRGDLDTIVAKALRKAPEERYASVTALADDLTRYLQDQPIRARRETIRYQAVKFIRRNRLAVVAGMLTLTALSAGLFVANRERLIAERRFNELRRLSNNVFALDRSIKDLAGSTEARQALVSMSLDYLEGLASDARSDLDLSQEIGEGYWRIGRIQGVPTELNLGDSRKAEDSLKKADAIIERVLTARPDSRAALLDSAVIAHDRMILAESDHRNADARAHARKAADRLDAFMRRPDVTDAEREQLSGDYGNIALSYSNIHMYSDAATYAHRAVDLARTLSSKRRFGQGLSLLANILRYEGDVDGAVAAIAEARAACETSVYTSDTQRMIDFYGVLLRQGLILGEDGGINANRPDDAIAALQRALDLTEDAARRDPNDSTSRGRVATSARELGNILRHRDPQRALAVYDLGLKRLGEIRKNLKARRDQAVLLADSSYPLRALSRGAEARQRIDAAIAILKETKDYPPAALTTESETYIVMRADADDLAARSRVPEAIRAYEQLRATLAASEPAAESDLRAASKLSVFYEALAELYRRDGQAAQADHISARRLQIWHQWDARLPANPFVARQLSSFSAPFRSSK